jgi:hypothetical protein
MKKVSIYLKLGIVFITFLCLTFFIEGQGKTDLADKIITVSSFVFGIILAFSISNRNSRLNSIKEKLREQDAKLLEIYYISKRFQLKTRELIKKKLDDFIIIQLDYRLIDFNKETPKKLEQLFSFFEKLKLNKAEEQYRGDIINILEDILEIRKEVSYQLENKMVFYEWLSLNALVGIIFYCLVFYFNTNNLASIVIISLLGVALSLLLFVLRDLDKLEWQEQNWIWKPLANLFIELNLLPYFPSDVFDRGRLSLKQVKKWDKLKKIRIAHYPKPYPDMTGKKIEIVQL